MNTFKMGFACKYKHPDSEFLSVKEIKNIESKYNTKTTTAKWLDNQTIEVAEDKLYSIALHNLKSIMALQKYVLTFPPELRMFRISSDILPFYTHEKWKYFYQRPEIQILIFSYLYQIGELARKHNIKLSMHPGQFCVLASNKEQVVDNSIAEIEYHVDMIRMMGFGREFQDFKCNVHISGKKGVEGILHIKDRLSKEALNCLTFENEEWRYGLDHCLELGEYFPVVLDVHHYWIREEKYIELQDPRIERVLESWRGVRPTMHYSQSKEFLKDYLKDSNKKIEISELLAIKEINKRKLSAHSDQMWNDYMNLYVKEFLKYFDIMFEAKDKNLAVLNYYQQYLK